MLGAVYYLGARVAALPGLIIQTSLNSNAPFQADSAQDRPPSK